VHNECGEIRDKPGGTTRNFQCNFDDVKGHPAPRRVSRPQPTSGFQRLTDLSVLRIAGRSYQSACTAANVIMGGRKAVVGAFTRLHPVGSSCQRNARCGQCQQQRHIHSEHRHPPPAASDHAKSPPNPTGKQQRANDLRKLAKGFSPSPRIFRDKAARSGNPCAAKNRGFDVMEIQKRRRSAKSFASSFRKFRSSQQNPGGFPPPPPPRWGGGFPPFPPRGGKKLFSGQACSRPLIQLLFQPRSADRAYALCR